MTRLMGSITPSKKKKGKKFKVPIVNRTYDRKEIKYGTYISIEIQRLLRGYLGRKYATLKRWERFNISAYSIQQAYKQYVIRKNFDVIITKKLNKNKKQLHKSIKNRIEIIEKSNGNARGGAIDKILRGDANMEEKMYLWRSALEIRRAHSHYSTDLILKALLASTGDLSRALTLMGNVDFTLKQLDTLNSRTRELFLPVSMLQNVNDNSSNNDDNNASTSKLDMIRQLRIKQDNSLQKKERKGECTEGGLDLSDTIFSCYFTKYHRGNENNVIPRKKKFMNKTDFNTTRLHNSNISMSPPNNNNNNNNNNTIGNNTNSNIDITLSDHGAKGPTNNTISVGGTYDNAYKSPFKLFGKTS
jgi:hypothetical protein